MVLIWLHEFINYLIYHEDYRTKPKLFTNNPIPILVILALYLLFCLLTGPRIMKNRRQFRLKTCLKTYNILQIVINAGIFYEFLQSGWGGQYNLRYEDIDYSHNSYAERMTRTFWLYYIAKLVELVETVFLVLQKKTDQITKIHIYHHILMPSVSLYILKYFAGGSLTLFAFLNCGVNVFMYSYYLMATMGPRMNKFKKCLTILQIIQLLFIFAHAIQSLFLMDFDWSASVVFTTIFNSLLFAILYIKFYMKTYTRRVKHENGIVSSIDQIHDDLGKHV